MHQRCADQQLRRWAAAAARGRAAGWVPHLMSSWNSLMNGWIASGVASQASTCRGGGGAASAAQGSAPMRACMHATARGAAGARAAWQAGTLRL
jgi:hypothetical protein